VFAEHATKLVEVGWLNQGRCFKMCLHDVQLFINMVLHETFLGYTKFYVKSLNISKAWIY
jgi:hypothetical protein